MVDHRPGPEFKVVVLGEKGVGKTCLVLRFTEGYFSQKQQSTIGAFFMTKRIQLPDGQSCKMQIWDTAGQERYRAMAPMYYRNASAAIVCFDITDEDSFITMKSWVEELKQNVTNANLVLAIACTKADLESQRVVSRARVDEFSHSINAIVCETSAKENFGITELFQAVSEKVLEVGLFQAGESNNPIEPNATTNQSVGLSNAARSAGFFNENKINNQNSDQSFCC